MRVWEKFAVQQGKPSSYSPRKALLHIGKMPLHTAGSRQVAATSKVTRLDLVAGSIHMRMSGGTRFPGLTQVASNGQLALVLVCSEA